MLRVWVGMRYVPWQNQRWTLSRAKFFIEKVPKPKKNDTNLLIFLDLSYNPCKIFRLYSLQGQNVKTFLIITYKKGKIFLILPITRGTCIPGLCWEPPRIRLSDTEEVDRKARTTTHLFYTLFCRLRHSFMRS